MDPLPCEILDLITDDFDWYTMRALALCSKLLNAKITSLVKGYFPGQVSEYFLMTALSYKQTTKISAKSGETKNIEAINSCGIIKSLILNITIDRGEGRLCAGVRDTKRDSFLMIEKKSSRRLGDVYDIKHTRDFENTFAWYMDQYPRHIQLKIEDDMVYISCNDKEISLKITNDHKIFVEFENAEVGIDYSDFVPRYPLWSRLISPYTVIN